MTHTVENEAVLSKGFQPLKLSFMIGAIADWILATNWFLIAAGVQMPNLLSGMVGEGVDYRYAMYIAAIFMAGWGGILAWGWFRPFERKDLLLLTATLIFISIVLEAVFYRSLLGGMGFVFGVVTRAVLIAIFSLSYFYSRAGTAKTECPPGT